MNVALGWPGIVRLGLVQTALGAIVVLLTSTINRVMVVELSLPAMVPGVLVGLHYAVQILRPAWGYGSDVGGRRTPWIVGGIALLAIGATGAAVATALAATHLIAGLALATFAFLLVGMGVGAAGTSLLAMLATCVAPQRRAAAATTVWVMMIAGFVITAPLAGHYLDPFTTTRLVVVTATVSTLAVLLACIAVYGVEKSVTIPRAPQAAKPPFREAFAQVWAEPQARRFTIFVFVSMLAYSAQDLILEPYAGIVFSMTPGATTKLSGLQHGGVLTGMLLVAFLASGVGGRVLGSLRLWTVIGCVASGLSLVAIALGGYAGPDYPLRAAVFALGLSNGCFATAAIGSMMGFASAGTSSREGTRMGMFGAAQGLAFGLGGFMGTVAVDVARAVADTTVAAYASVFLVEAALFVLSALLAVRIAPVARDTNSQSHGHGFAPQT